MSVVSPNGEEVTSVQLHHEGDLKAAFEEVPEVTDEDKRKQRILDMAREGVLEKIFGISFLHQTPGMTIQIMDARRHPQDYMGNTSLIHQDFKIASPANDNEQVIEEAA